MLAQRHDGHGEAEGNGNLGQVGQRDGRRERGKRDVAARDDLDATGHEQPPRGRKKSTDDRERHEANERAELEPAEHPKHHAGQQSSERHGDQRVTYGQFNTAAGLDDKAADRHRQDAEDGDGGVVGTSLSRR